ncbi:radical SAM family heme chaperone HemW [bacterium]|nr:radical SAM family heme chaperone HemW [bacterium]
MKGKSLYLHIPFCRKKCPYCHFFVTGYKKEKIDAFTDLLIKEIKSKEHETPLLSIYFGGGTPFLLGAKNVKKILEVTGPAKEITLEANPEDVTFEAMEAFAKAGINRVSLGVQSFDDGLLTFLGRNHSGAKAAKAVQETYDAGIENITIDLMYDVPNQTREMFQKTLATTKTLPISHLSLYNLTIEPYTPFHKKEKSLELLRPTSKDSTLMLKDAVAALEEIGLKRYEISAFAKSGKESVHNTGYWEGRPFHGIGPSAFSYIDGARFQNICNLKKYEERVKNNINPKDFYEKLPHLKRECELLMTGLRMLKGIKKETFQNALSHKQQEILRLLQEGYLIETKERLLLSPKGLLFYDDVAMDLI